MLLAGTDAGIFTNIPGKSLGEELILLTGAGKAFCAGGDLVDFYPEDRTIRNSMRNRWLNWSTV